jgi:heat-inducible transcriptional repressor
LLELLGATFDERFSVRIGSELDDEVLRQCSIVVAPFGPSADAHGLVGVIGPMRMDYERVIATANLVARLIESTLGASES